MKLEKGKSVIDEPFWRHPDNGEEIIMDKRYVDLNEILLALPKSAAKIIEDWPAADVRENRKGKWEVVKTQALFPGMEEHPVYGCSECGYKCWDILDNMKERHKYCPSCGADMRGKPD